MAWFKTDDKFAMHPKVIQAGNAAIGLWIRAGTWSADQSTDGHIPTEMITVLGGKTADATKLVNAGLWERDDAGYQFHDWQDYQPTRADRTLNKAKGALGAHNRWHKKQPSADCEFCHQQAADA